MSAPGSLAARRFHQVDVFSAEPLRGNPLAVVHDADGLSDEQMAAIARWTNLSETTFLLPPTDGASDYHVRIFTPFAELPFAGHPTLGSAWAWLAAGGQPRQAGRVWQQCGVGRVEVRRDGDRLAFAAPPLQRTGALPADVRAQACRAVGLADDEVLADQWVDNGPGWAALLVASDARVRAIQPDWAVLDGLKLGVVGPCPTGGECAFEVRSFVGGGGFEDPVTGSLNAGLAQWLIGSGRAPDRYVAAQGSALQRAGRVHVERAGETIWVGGDVVALIDGTITV